MNTLECFGVYREITGVIFDYLNRIVELSIPSRVILAWERGGLLVPAWKENGELERPWINVCGHMAAAGLLGYRICKRVPAEFLEFSVAEIVEALLVHDSFKRREYEMTEKTEKTVQGWSEANRRAENASREFLVNLGFNERVAGLANTTGDFGLRKIIQGQPTLAEKVIFYCDCSVSNYDIVGYKKRFDELLPYFEPGGRYYFGGQEYLKRYKRTHREVHDSLVIPLQEELARLLGCSNPDDLHNFVFVD